MPSKPPPDGPGSNAELKRTTTTCAVRRCGRKVSVYRTPLYQRCAVGLCAKCAAEFDKAAATIVKFAEEHLYI